MATRKVIGLKPRWDVAPAWVGYAAIDWAGQSWWFESLPVAGVLNWNVEPNTKKLVFGPPVAATSNWRSSIQVRPADKQFKQHMHLSKIVAFYRGRTIQEVRRVDRHATDDAEWVDVLNPTWDLEMDYRIKPRKRK